MRRRWEHKEREGGVGRGRERRREEEGKERRKEGR